MGRVEDTPHASLEKESFTISEGRVEGDEGDEEAQDEEDEEIVKEKGEEEAEAAGDGSQTDGVTHQLHPNASKARGPKKRPRTKAERLERKGKKAGAKEFFPQEETNYLKSHMETYLSLDKEKGSVGKNKRLGEFRQNTQIFLSKKDSVCFLF